MSDLNMTAVRALRRALAPVQQSRALAEYADAGFDAGEWSGPAHAEAAMREMEEMAEAVGERFSLGGEHLLTMLMEADQLQDSCWWDALQANVEGRML